MALGIPFLRKGFSLGRALPQNKANGYVFVGIIIFLLILLLAKPACIYFSTEGPGSMRAPLALSLGAGLLAGFLAQRSRLCLAGGVRDFILFRDFYLLYGFIAILVVALIGNLLLGSFKPGFAGQPIAHSDGLEFSRHDAGRPLLCSPGRLSPAAACIGTRATLIPPLL